jgi:DNA-directed RNA polymerase subunit RPC12/RpoP
VFCVECGKEIPEAIKFCPDCGTSQIIKVKPAKTKSKKKALPKKIDYSKMAVSELKDRLNKAKLPTGGNKAQLIWTLKNPNSKETYKRMSSKQLKNVLRRKKLPFSGSRWQLLERLTKKNWKKEEKKSEKINENIFEELEKEKNKKGKFLLQKIWDYQDKLLYFVGYGIFYFYLATASYERGTKEKNIMDFSFRDIIDVFILDLWVPLLCFIMVYGVIFGLDRREDSIHQNGYIGSIITKFWEIIGILTIVVTVIITIAALPEILHYSEPTIFDSLKVLGICGAALTMLIIFFALNNNESKIEAAAEAWLMLTVLGAIFAIILYLVIF